LPAPRLVHNNLFRKQEIHAIRLSSTLRANGWSSVETEDAAKGYNRMGRGIAAEIFYLNRL